MLLLLHGEIRRVKIASFEAEKLSDLDRLVNQFLDTKGYDINIKDIKFETVRKGFYFVAHVIYEQA